MLTKRFKVYGIVQGVGYRFFAVRVANSLGVRGYVKNLRDGAVEVVAQADSAEALSTLLERLRQGPASAVVSDIEVEDIADAPAFASFEIKY